MSPLTSELADHCKNLQNRDTAQTGVARQLEFRSCSQVALVSHADADPLSVPGCDGVVEVYHEGSAGEAGLWQELTGGYSKTNIADVGRFDYAQTLVDRSSPNAYSLAFKLDCNWL
jgi:hypothetical protein